MFRQLVIISCFLFISSCDKEENKVDNFNDKYEYTAYVAKSLVICANGILDMSIDSDSTIAGTWNINSGAGFSEKEVGPQVGTGELEGQIEKGKILLNLNPDWADNNIFLQGQYAEDQFGGNWIWSTIIGQTALGGFIIKKQ